MAMLKLQAPALKQAIAQQGEKIAILEIYVPAVMQAINQQAEKWLC